MGTGRPFLPSATLTSTSSYESPLHSGLLPSDPFLPAPRAPAAQPWSSTQEACRFSSPHGAPPPALPRWGAGWVYVGRQCWPALPFPPSHPKAKGQATPPLSLSCFPGQVHPGHSLPGVRVPHSSGFTPPTGRAGIPAWGVGWGRAAGGARTAQRPLCPLP